MRPELPRSPDRPRMPALTDAECSLVDHYLAVVDLLARINPARSTGHAYTCLRAAQSLATEARALLEALELMWERGEREIHVPTLTQALRALDAEVQRQTAGLANRKVVTNHDAFGYYLDRYHLELVGSVIPSFDSSAELSGRDIRDLVARIRATGAKAIFSETSLPPRAAETIGREAGVRVVTGSDALYGDSLGPPGSDGDTYLKMIRHNTRTIVSNLGET